MSHPPLWGWMEVSNPPSPTCSPLRRVGRGETRDPLLSGKMLCPKVRPGLCPWSPGGPASPQPSTQVSLVFPEPALEGGEAPEGSWAPGMGSRCSPSSCKDRKLVLNVIFPVPFSCSPMSLKMGHFPSSALQWTVVGSTLQAVGGGPSGSSWAFRGRSATKRKRP